MATAKSTTKKSPTRKANTSTAVKKQEVPAVDPVVEAMTMKESQPKKVRPKLFFEANEPIKVQVSGFYNGETGKLEFCVPGKVDNPGNDLIMMLHEFEFKPVSYDRLNLYRMQSTVYNAEDKTTSINLIRLRNYFWTFHLDKWNYTDENDNPMPLTHDPNGALSDESLIQLYKIPTMILDTVIGLFEKQINLA